MKRSYQTIAVAAGLALAVAIGAAWWWRPVTAETPAGTLPGRNTVKQTEMSVANASAAVVARKPRAVLTAGSGSRATTNKPSFRVVDDRHAAAETLESRTAPAGTDGLIKRVRLVRDDGRLLRVDETLREDPVTGETRLVAQSAVMGDHIIVKLATEADRSGLEALNARFGATIRKELPRRPVYVVAFPDAGIDTVPGKLAAYGASELVAYAEADPIVYAQVTPNDPRYPDLWGMPMIDAPLAWDVSVGDGHTVVGVIDTGINLGHEDLRANLWTNPGEIAGNGVDDDGNGYVDDVHGYDFYNRDGNPDDDNYHGTHVAGTIAAVGNNGKGVAGVAWNGRVMALKFLNSSGGGSTLDAILALEYVLDMHARGVPVRLTNNSWGGGSYSRTLDDTIGACEAAGILFVAAAGNWGTDNDSVDFYPANYPGLNVIAVANSTAGDRLSDSSNFGATRVDLAAPGSGILSTELGSRYLSVSGTSMAAPHVSGAAALLWDVKPAATWQEIRDAIFAGVETNAFFRGLVATDGRLNVNRALRLLDMDIEHDPLLNTTNSGAGYTIEAGVAPSLLLDTNSVYLVWRSNSDSTEKVRMRHVTNDVYSGVIPARPRGTTFSYYLRARTTAGIETRHPADAPTAMHTFSVTAPVTLAVTGTPARIGSVSPGYGTAVYPAGVALTVSAEPFTAPSNGMRNALTGWVGSGSVPPVGGASSIDFVLATNTVVDWQWETQYRLTQYGTPAGIFNTSAWWTAGATAATRVAESLLSLNSTNYRFAGWYINEIRQADSNGEAVNPALGITMHEPRDAQALYIREALDADGDGIQDWWEHYYIGSTNLSADGDEDTDGYSNREEFRDHTDPHDPASVPEAPRIVHLALSDPQRTPAPWDIEAEVTDNCAVSNVVLYWQRNGAVWRDTPMVHEGTGSLYRARIPAPGTNWNDFAYCLIAEDMAGNLDIDGEHTFDVAYPVLDFQSDELEDVLVRSGTSVTRNVTLVNRGNAPLAWCLTEFRGDAVEGGTNGWQLAGGSNIWHIASDRSVSPSHAWHLGGGIGAEYTASLQAELITPRVHIWDGGSPRLTFRHWIATELKGDPESATQTWDGGIVEIATNGGAFEQIFPLGGYPYTMDYWQAPQFPEDTPCYAGTGGWQSAVFDLTPWQGADVRIRFHFTSDDNTFDEGWYIDDVAFEADAGGVRRWVCTDRTNGVVSAVTDDSIPIVLDGVLETGDRNRSLRFEFNDPLVSTIEAPASIRIRSAPHLSSMTAAQTSTNGEGLVTLRHCLSDADGDACALDLAVSSDGGLTWSDPWVADAVAALGAPAIANGTNLQVSGVLTEQDGRAVTNTVVVEWATRAGPDPVAFAPDIRVVARLWDGLFWSDPVTSAAFVVDNQAPSGPDDVSVSSHSPFTWSTNRVVDVSWPAAIDQGSAVSYRLGGRIDGSQGGADVKTLSTTNGQVTLPFDHAAWRIAVQARDEFGNTGVVVSVGPYGLDTQPPSAAAAQVQIAASEGGDYVIGTNLSVSWTGFADAGSGLSDYYVSFADGGGSTQGLAAASSGIVLSGAVPDATNQVFVWARDILGQLGSAASVSILVLDGNTDYDQDGQTTADEDVAGTDAGDGGSYLALRGCANAASPQGREFVISWNGVTGRVYTVLWQPAMTNGGKWVETAFTNVPGTGGSLSYTDVVHDVEQRFYRVRVQRR